MENQVFERQIFKEGDRVFDAAFGWGEVFRYDTDSFFPAMVHFDSGDRKPYTWDGRLNRIANPTLSFNAYKLEGFSQERPKPEIKFPCTGVFGGKKFGICVGKDNVGFFRCEKMGVWLDFQPMTFEKYCKLNNIKL
jgi:hypothetical protein